MLTDFFDKLFVILWVHSDVVSGVVSYPGVLDVQLNVHAVAIALLGMNVSEINK